MTRPQRADARRNQEALLDAAAAVFVASGVEAPIRDIAARAGVGTATIYRHFPTRADLIVAVYRHQVEELAEAEFALTPYAALARWFDDFVDFVVTKQGLAAVLQSDDPCYDPLHSYFVERLVPVCTRLLEAAAESGEIQPGLDAYELMRGVGGICAGAGKNLRYDARRLVGFLIAGLRRPG
ncbi:TetR/AcrR family transcriptional regulator [Paractinoplanes toevensis]|uniref:TetR family transcriptional regulator n=1 Tax=Paractinoplanes toevensis TaxID=571911 RepID=A0A919TBV2_9ACTN|nr:TetR/AcrR family transcriptional regulator [Actinoplanes toevensis]GIM91906.1 TetR family transcriptional regulator [Actinoplanes toevensis]